LEQTEPGAAYYNIPLTWRIKGSLDIPALERSFSNLLERHEALRTVFPVIDGVPVQRAGTNKFNLRVENAAGAAAPGVEAARLARECAGRPFDLENGPLYRIVLFQLGTKDYWLVMVVHQMVFDGTSMRVLNRDLGECYRAFTSGEQPRLEPLPVRYADFAVWQREMAHSEMIQQDEAFWTEQLAKPYQPLRPPTDHQRRNFGITPGRQQAFVVSKDQMARLKQLSADAGVTPFAAFLGAFQAFLGKLAAQDDVLTLVSIAARNAPEVRNMVGLVANVLPMRLTLGGSLSLREVIRSSGQGVSAALAHQSLPLSRILEKLSTDSTSSGASALQTLVIYNNAPLAGWTVGDVSFGPSLELDNGTAKFDLLLEVWDSPAGLNGHLKFRTDLFEPPTIAALLGQWEQFLAAALSNPDAPLPQPERTRKATNDAIVSEAAAQRFYVPAKSELEQTLVNIWQRVFGLERIGINDNFFSLGGHSLLAVKLINAIEQETGQKLRLCKIFSEPTIARLARTMKESGGAVGTSIVEIQPQGQKAPLYLVHGVGGGMFWGYNNLAHHLGTEQPVYGFKSRGMDGLEEFATIEAMAAQYVSDLKKFQPHGPYHLGGYCFGGNVAFEMARQLKAEGAEVGLLLLINCWPNNSSYTQMSLSPDVLAKGFWNFCFRMGHQLHWAMRHPVDFFKARSRWAWKRARAVFTNDPLDRIAVEDVVDLSSRPVHEQQLWRTHVSAWLKYMPGTYEGRITLLRTRGHPLVCSFDHQMGWGAYAKAGVTVRTCPGDHESILENENVAHAAREVRALLEGAAKALANPKREREQLDVYRLANGPSVALQGAACLSSVAIPAAECLPQLAEKIGM